jgi:hypothetical protein
LEHPPNDSPSESSATASDKIVPSLSDSESDSSSTASSLTEKTPCNTNRHWSDNDDGVDSDHSVNTEFLPCSPQSSVAADVSPPPKFIDADDWIILWNKIQDLELTADRHNSQLQQTCSLEKKINENHLQILDLIETQNKIRETVDQNYNYDIQTLDTRLIHLTADVAVTRIQMVDFMNDLKTNVEASSLEIENLKTHATPDIDADIQEKVDIIRVYFEFFQTYIAATYKMGMEECVVNELLFEAMTTRLTYRNPPRKPAEFIHLIVYGKTEKMFKQHFDDVTPKLIELLKISLASQTIESTIISKINKNEPFLKLCKQHHFKKNEHTFNAGQLTDALSKCLPHKLDENLHVKYDASSAHCIFENDTLMFNLNFPNLHESEKDHELRFLTTLEDRCIFIYQKYKYVRLLFEEVDTPLLSFINPEQQKESPVVETTPVVMQRTTRGGRDKRK